MNKETGGMEWQVASLELSRKLKELGVRQESAFKWMYDADGAWVAFIGTSNILPARNFKEPDLYCAAFTVAELGEMLPQNCQTLRGPEGGKARWMCKKLIDGEADGPDFMDYWTLADNESDARAKMLCYLIEQKIVTVEEISGRL